MSGGAGTDRSGADGAGASADGAGADGAGTDGATSGADGAGAAEAGLQAISHGGRRTMLRLASSRECTASELADAAGLSRSAASQHLKVLRDAGLVHVRVDANRRLYRVDAERLGRLRAFLDAFWDDQLDALRVQAEAQAAAEATEEGARHAGGERGPA